MKNSFFYTLTYNTICPMPGPSERMFLSLLSVSQIRSLHGMTCPSNSPADFSKDDFYDELLATTIFEVSLAVAKTHLHPVHTSQSFPSITVMALWRSCSKQGILLMSVASIRHQKKTHTHTTYNAHTHVTMCTFC